MSMTRRRLLDDTFKKSVVGNPAIATDSLARMYPGIVMNGWTTQDGMPTPETPVPIVSAGTQNQETGKWEYEIEVGCGNLFNISKSENNTILNAGGTTVENTFFATSDYISGIPGTQYSRTIKGATGNFFYDDQKQYISVVNGSLFTIPENAKYVRFSYNIVVDDSYKEIMLNPGANLLPYEPYRPPQTVTLTAGRPLTKWDRLEKRNGQWGWVYKSAEIESYMDESVPGEYYSTTGQLSVGAQVWYETTTETFAPLSESEQEAMNALHTYRPTTVLSNQQDCEMALTYKTRKSMEVTA